MPKDKYITLHIDDQSFDLPTESAVPLIDYILEEEDFEQKRGA